MAALWDTVKETADITSFDHYLENFSLLVALQAALRGLIARARTRKLRRQNEARERQLANVASGATRSPVRRGREVAS